MLSSRPLKLAVLGFAVLAAGCDRQSGDGAQPQASASAGPAAAATGVPKGMIDRSHKGSAMPDFTVADPAGKQLRLADLKGKPVLVNLWATWCAPCVVEMPALDGLAGKRADIRVLTVSQDMGQPEKVAAFFAERKLVRLEPWLDPENNLSFHYGTGTLPTTIYYGADGREIWRFVGERDWTDAATDGLLAEK